ncbi:hypothetical protein PoB_001007200 [Plakobranchus ocellatus]|uniref:Uncharacterized protein n=1 Tax=Plakobranchus ocellatus TaxID=259542 RepID=A0AAV3YKY1_9GAST|nr:hypothetical protein PoB_001007200 [Plakobranchus ocellatus]
MEEEEEEEIESDQGQLKESLISRSTQEAEVRGAGLAEEPSTSNSGRMVEIELVEESSEVKDYYIKDLIESPGVVDSQMTQQKKASRRTERIRKSRTYLIEGNHVCRSAFLFILW